MCFSITAKFAKTQGDGERKAVETAKKRTQGSFWGAG
jgi:hypothetical protein